VENFQDTLDDIQGPLHVHDIALSNLFVFDYLNTVGHTYTLTTGQVQRDGAQPITITYDNMAQLVVATANNPYSGHTPNTVNVWSLGNVFAVVEVGSDDTVTVGQGGSMANLLGDVRIQSVLGQVPRQVTLDASADPARTVTLSGGVPTFGYLVSGLLPPSTVGRGNIGLALDPATPVTIKTGLGNDTFSVHDLTGAPALTLDGSGGSNTLDFSSYTQPANLPANTWTINGPDHGTVNGLTFSSIGNLIGSPANDTFAFQTGGSLSGALDAGGGSNTLDYTGYQGDLLVDLLLHTASLVGQGVANVANVTGSQGNDLIVGDGNANVLVGGTGRNVILGHGGGDTIRGGGGFNLLISDLTFYDDKLPYLRDLMQYWDNPSVVFLDDLVNPLKSKNGFTAPDGLVLVFNKTTVTPDNVLDQVFGGSGPNWFIVDKQDVSSIINNQGGQGPLLTDRLTVI
jgi:Ca2+-binding RTX toxin-like protein